jgi:hypothetical protein
MMQCAILDTHREHEMAKKKQGKRKTYREPGRPGKSDPCPLCDGQMLVMHTRRSHGLLIRYCKCTKCGENKSRIVIPDKAGPQRSIFDIVNTSFCG